MSNEVETKVYELVKAALLRILALVAIIFVLSVIARYLIVPAFSTVIS